MVTRRAGCHASDTLCFAMPSSVAALYLAGYRKLIPWLLGQPGRMVSSRSRESLGRLFSALPGSVSADLLWAVRRRRGRSQVCRGAFSSPVWLLLLHCPTMRQSSNIRAGAPPSLSWSPRSSDSLCYCSNKNVKMSSSSSSSTSNSDGQGKAKSKSQFQKRGSLQSTPSAGECRMKERRETHGCTAVDIYEPTYGPV